jgi:hypothetical protein
MYFMNEIVAFSSESVSSPNQTQTGSQYFEIFLHAKAAHAPFPNRKEALRFSKLNEPSARFLAL